MRKIALTTLIVCLSALLSSLPTPAHAQPPVSVSGTFDYTFNVNDVRRADDNTFVYATEAEVWSGDFVGNGQATFRVEQFSSAGFWNVWLRTTFDGQVLGNKYGVMVIQLVGKKPQGENWYGQWVILSGAGDLATVHGSGNWWGPGFGHSPAIFYSGTIQVD